MPRPAERPRRGVLSLAFWQKRHLPAPAAVPRASARCRIAGVVRVQHGAEFWQPLSATPRVGAGGCRPLQFFRLLTQAGVVARGCHNVRRCARAARLPPRAPCAGGLSEGACRVWPCLSGWLEKRDKKSECERDVCARPLGHGGPWVPSADAARGAGFRRGGGLCGFEPAVVGLRSLSGDQCSLVQIWLQSKHLDFFRAFKKSLQTQKNTNHKQF